MLAGGRVGATHSPVVATSPALWVGVGGGVLSRRVWRRGDSARRISGKAWSAARGAAATALGVSSLLDGPGIPAFERLLATAGIAPYGVLSLPAGWHLH